MWINTSTKAGDEFFAGVFGQTPNIVRAAIGEGSVDPSMLADQTEIAGYVKDAGIVRSWRQGNVYSIAVRVDNVGITSPTALSQIGLFASFGGGDEVLITLVQSDTPPMIQPPSQQQNWSFEIQIDIIVSGAADINVEIDWNAFATREQLRQLADLESLYTIRISFDSSFANESFTVSAGGFNFSGIVPASLTADVPVPSGGIAYMVNCGDANFAVNVGLLFGIYPISIYDTPDLHTLSWAAISQIAGEGNAENYWSIGDEKDIQLSTGEVLTLQIYGFEHDDLTSGGKAPITFGMKNLMSETRRMNAANTNATSFSGSEMFSWLNGELWNSLPSDLQAIIKPVNKITSEGNMGTNLLTESMNVFLFSQAEYSNSTLNVIPGEGTMYPIFSNNASRIKRLANGVGSANIWRGRSPRSTDPISFMATSNNGDVAVVSANHSAGGVCFGFCI